MVISALADITFAPSSVPTRVGGNSMGSISKPELRGPRTEIPKDRELPRAPSEELLNTCLIEEPGHLGLVKVN